MTRCFPSRVCLVLVAASAVAAPQPAEKAPTTDQIYATFEDAEYPKVLRQIAAALALKGDAAAAYDRHELLVLKGEALARQKNFTAAAEAFDAAARATIVETKAAVARSTAEIMRRAKAGVYTPAGRNGAAGPIDVADPVARPQAFVAMFEEARPKVAAAVEAAKKSDKVPAMLAAFAMLRDLRALEMAAGGADAESAALAKALADRARTVMARAVAEGGDTVEAQQDFALRQVEDMRLVGGRVIRAGSGTAGLTLEGVQELRQIASDCERIRRVAADLRGIYDAGSAEEKARHTLQQDAGTVAEGARTLLGIPWSGYYTEEALVGPGAQYLDPSMWEQYPEPPPPRPGTNSVRRPIRGNPTAGPRGVGTAGGAGGGGGR